MKHNRLGFAIVVACVVTFMLGRLSVGYQLPQMEVRVDAKTKDVEFYRAGILCSEIKPSDGHLYAELISIVYDVPVKPGQ